MTQWGRLSLIKDCYLPDRLFVVGAQALMPEFAWQAIALDVCEFLICPGIGDAVFAIAVQHLAGREGAVLRDRIVVKVAGTKEVFLLC